MSCLSSTCTSFVIQLVSQLEYTFRQVYTYIRLIFDTEPTAYLSACKLRYLYRRHSKYDLMIAQGLARIPLIG